MPLPSKADATLVPEPVARRQDLAAVARVSAANDRRSFAALDRQRAELRELKRSHEELSQRVAALQEQSRQALAGLLDRMAGMERQAQAAVAQTRSLLAESRSARALAAGQRRELDAMALKASLDKVTAAVNTAQAAAFGQTGSLTAPNNLTLLANQLFWSFIDPVLRGLGIQTGASPGFVEYLTPLGALFAGHVALAGRQHERFITGVSTFDGSKAEVSEDLQGRVAEPFFPRLRQRTDVPVTLSPLDPSIAVFSARVKDGILSITARVASPPDSSLALAVSVPGAPRTVRVAWIVDLGADVG